MRQRVGAPESSDALSRHHAGLKREWACGMWLQVSRAAISVPIDTIYIFIILILRFLRTEKRMLALQISFPYDTENWSKLTP